MYTKTFISIIKLNNFIRFKTRDGAVTVRCKVAVMILFRLSIISFDCASCCLAIELAESSIVLRPSATKRRHV
jgi:hypothetical protein